MGRKRTCELPFCKGIVEGTHNKRRCDNDKNIHLHLIISDNVKRIMRYIESHDDFTANDVNMALFKNELDKNEKGSMYRLFQAMIREKYIVDKGKKAGLKVYSFSPELKLKKAKAAQKRAENRAKRLAEQQNEIDEIEEINDSAIENESESVQELSKLDEAPVAQEPVNEEPEISPEEHLLSILKKFVYKQKGQWNHYDWLELIKRQDIKDFGKSEEEIGTILEEQKAIYWAQRNG